MKTLVLLLCLVPSIALSQVPRTPPKLGFVPRDDAERRHIAELYRRAGYPVPESCWVASSVAGQPRPQIPPAITQAARAVGRVRSGDNLGSGTHIGGGLIATAAHVISGGPHSYRSHSGRTYDCSVVATDKQWDMALLSVRGNCDEPFVEVSTSNPARGDPLFLAGYGGTSRLGVSRGACIAYRTNRSGGIQRDWIEVGGAVARGGDSGGAIFDSSGRLVGPLWGAAPGQTVGTSTGRFCLFARPWFPRLHRWKRERWDRIWGSSPHYPTQFPPGADPHGPTPVPDNPRPIQRPTPGDGTPDPYIEPTPIDYKEIISGVVGALKADKKFRDSLEGEDGEDGKDGPSLEDVKREVVLSLKSDSAFKDSLRGAPGKVDPSDLKAAISAALADLPPVTFQILKDLNGDGVITDDAGNVVYTIKPGTASEVLTQRKKLGEAIRIIHQGIRIRVTGDAGN